MTFDAVNKMIGLNADPVTADACRYLETFGQRFAIDFGTQNAIEKAGSWLIENNPHFGELHDVHLECLLAKIPVTFDCLKLTHDDIAWLAEMQITPERPAARMLTDGTTKSSISRPD